MGTHFNGEDNIGSLPYRIRTVTLTQKPRGEAEATTTTMTTPKKAASPSAKKPRKA